VLESGARVRAAREVAPDIVTVPLDAAPLMDRLLKDKPPVVIVLVVADVSVMRTVDPCGLSVIFVGVAPADHTIPVPESVHVPLPMLMTRVVEPETEHVVPDTLPVIVVVPPVNDRVVVAAITAALKLPDEDITTDVADVRVCPVASRLPVEVAPIDPDVVVILPLTVQDPAEHATDDALIPDAPTVTVAPETEKEPVPVNPRILRVPEERAVAVPLIV